MKHTLKQQLLEETDSEVKFDPITRKIYSVDASIYEVMPLGVVIPKTQTDLQKCVTIAAKNGVPIIPRGAATGITGGCLGEGLVIDTSKYLNKILHLDLEKKLVKCEPGVIQDDLNMYLAPHGLRLGPDTSTGNRATIGGMAANCAAGAHSLFYGTMADAVHEIELILSSGEVVTFNEIWQKGEIFRTLEEIRKEDAKVIESHFPSIPRRASGYALDRIIKPNFNPAEIIIGSEGTFGIIQSITLKVVPKPTYLEMYLIAFDSMQKAMEAVPTFLKDHPFALEMIDDIILEAGRNSPGLRGRTEWLTAIPQALIVAEFNHPVDLYLNLPGVSFVQKLTDPKEMQHVWDLRKAGLGLLLSKRTYSRAIAFIEDISVPPQNLARFMDKFLPYLAKLHMNAGIYGHVGPGCLHIRPYLDLRAPEDIVLLKKMMEDVADLVKENGGAMSGEHGDGLIRSWLNERLFGKEIIAIFQKLKHAFDPLGLMNPHKIVDPLPVDTHLRKSPTINPPTFLSFKKEGGITLTADLCNGNGNCRKKEGVMCPSFQVTHDEYDSTRARAVMFRDALRDTDPLSNNDLHEILDLCIQCKGCKTECPSNVDMAKMKSETLFHFQEKYGYSLRSRIFAHLDTLSKWFHPLRDIYNPLLKTGLSSILGIVGPMPLFAPKRFSKMAAEIKQPPGKKVALFIDTYTEFYCPEIGMAAIKVLNKLGYNVTVPPWTCCGRPALSKGFLNKAKANAIKLSETLEHFAHEKIPFISLEPSCHFTLFDEFSELPRPQHWYLFDSFIEKHLPLPITSLEESVVIHGHCHQKALQGMKDTLSCLQSIPNLFVREIPSGCCGMAGSFGHEKEHAEFSKQIGELVLLPYIRSLPDSTSIIANGYSCRTQIKQYTNRKAQHLAEWLSERM